MELAEDWKPSKFTLTEKGLRGSRAPGGVGAGSRLISDKVGAFYSEVIPRYAHGALLDLGCGMAPLYGLYSRYIDSATCVDWASSLHPNPHLDLVQDLNEPLSLESDRFDTVILSDVLEHIREPVALLREIHRVLVPGGVLLMNVPFLYGLHEQPHDYYRYTRHALEFLTTRAGLDVVELAPLGGYPEVVTDLVAKIVSRLPVVGGPVAVALQALTAWLTRRGLGRTASRRTSELFPLGYAMVARRST